MPNLAWRTSKEQKYSYWKLPNSIDMPGAPSSKLDLSLACSISKGGDDQPIQIIASLENSTISCGGLLVDARDNKSYFQDRVNVSMTIERHPDLVRVSDGPATANGSSSTSSTISFSVSGGVNAGFFGPTPTGGANVGASMSSSHSFSRNLSDFTVTNRSDNHTARHEYHMNASSGAPYKHPHDLVPVDNMDFGDHFKGITLFDPPELAIANLPIISQMVWQANHNRDIDETLMLTIKVEQHLASVSGTNKFFTVHWDTGGQTITYTHKERLPLHKLIAMKGTSLSSLGV